tara:strand:+ start:632 stop:835 length:204 start_codon:yes stop_codon:yes gene_type:complete
MKVRPSDLTIRQENSSFAIYVDPYGGEYFYNKTLKNLSKYPTEFDDRVYECSSKTEAKKIIINLLNG